MKKFDRLVVIAPTRSTCSNIFYCLTKADIPETLLMKEKGREILEAVKNLESGGFGVVAGTGTGKTASIKDIALQVLGEDLRIDIITREHESTEYTWSCNVLIITPGVALHWLKQEIITITDLILIDEIHQTSDHLEFSLMFAKRPGQIFIWMSATIDPSVYYDYLNADRLLECSAFDKKKKSKAEVCPYEPKENGKGYESEPDRFLEEKFRKFLMEKRGAAVFVPTRAKAEELAEKFSKKGFYTEFYHGGESVDKLEDFFTGRIPKPFMIFMTIAGASSLNIAGLDTVVIVDEMYDTVPVSGVMVLKKMILGNNEILQMGGRVNGRVENSEVYIISLRKIDFYNLKPTVPKFVMGGDLQRLALICANLGADIRDMEPIVPIDMELYKGEVERFRKRGIIEKDDVFLTKFGEGVETLPVDPDWAEIIIHAFPEEGEDLDLLDISIISSCIPSLYSLLHNNSGILKDFKVKGSDHLTAVNIIIAALKNFGYIREYDGELNYFLGDGIREWCHNQDFNFKAIKEVLIALKSLYRRLKMDLPYIEDLNIIKTGDELHEKFIDLLARVQSLEFVFGGYSSRAKSWRKEVSIARSSVLITLPTEGGGVLGKIHRWKDHEGDVCATIEGTEIPGTLVIKHGTIISSSVEKMDGEKIALKHDMEFAGESIGIIQEWVDDSELPKELMWVAQEMLVDYMVSGEVAEINEINESADKERTIFLLERLGHQTDAILRMEYVAILKKKKIFSLKALLQALESGKLKEYDFILKAENYADSEELAKIKEEYVDTINSGGKIFHIDYIKDYWGENFFPVVNLSEEDIKRAKEDKLIHPYTGKEIKLCYGHYEADSFSQLKDWIEREERAAKIREIKDKKEEHHLKGFEQVSVYFNKLFLPVADDDFVLGYLALESNYEGIYNIVIKDKLEEATISTKLALWKLFHENVKDAFAIPEEDIFYNKRRVYDYYSEKSARELTDAGEMLKKFFKIATEEILKEKITKDNIGEMIDVAKQAAKNILANFLENMDLFLAGIEPTFESLIKNKRAEELGYIFSKVQEITNYSEAQIVKTIFELTKEEQNGKDIVVKRGNKLWMALREKFPGDKKEFEVNIEGLCMTLIELLN